MQLEQLRGLYVKAFPVTGFFLPDNYRYLKRFTRYFGLVVQISSVEGPMTLIVNSQCILVVSSAQHFTEKTILGLQEK